MKRFYLALAMLAALPAAASAQTILNEGFETTSTDQYSPNFPDGWSTVDSYTGNNDRYRWNVYYYEKKGTMTGTHCASVDSPMFTVGEDRCTKRRQNFSYLLSNTPIKRHIELGNQYFLVSLQLLNDMSK